MCFTYTYKSILFLISIVAYLTVTGQVKNPKVVLSPNIVERTHFTYSNNTSLYRIAIKKDFPAKLQRFQPLKIADYDSVAFYLIKATYKELIDSVLPIKEVLFIENGKRYPRVELLVSNMDLETNNIRAVHRRFSDLDGNGMTVSIKEEKPDTTDVDLAGRFVTTPLSSSELSAHASIMATIIAGGGNTWYTTKGAAWASKVTSANFVSILPEPSSEYQRYDITVQNHSYGVDIENFYGVDAAMYDASAISSPSLLHIFSSGNNGTSVSQIGPYAGVLGFANLTGSFKMAKNILTVGATDAYSNVSGQSSKGPAFDGRVKPELTAYGVDGTSGAAALVSGTCLLLQQRYKQIKGVLPSNALIKAIVLNSADDRGNKHVDYANGFGSLNALNAVRTIDAGHFMSGSVTNGSSKEFSLNIPIAMKSMKVTLVWNDPPAQPNAVKALLNDLDLEVTNTLTNETWKPWVLNKYSHKDSLNASATRDRDSINNTEQVTIDSPSPGLYSIKVKGYILRTPLQAFHIAYQMDSTDSFEWYYPINFIPVLSSSTTILRWKSSYPSSTGELQFSIDNGSTWQVIASSINLEAGNLSWNVPSIASSAMLRMNIGPRSFLSDTIIISPMPAIKVGFDCPDSTLFHWKVIPTVTKYKFYKLGSRYLEPFILTSDSVAIVQKAADPSLYHAVAPIFNDFEGARSYVINHTTQSIGCYIQSFSVEQVDDVAELYLKLGSLYNLSKVILEKRETSSFKPIQEVLNPGNGVIKFSDSSLIKGLNLYRMKLETIGGGVIYSGEKGIFHFKGSNYVIYPNPISGSRDIFITKKNFDEATLQIYTTSGIKILEKKLVGTTSSITSERLDKGVYMVRIIESNKQEETLKLVVY